MCDNDPQPSTLDSMYHSLPVCRKRVIRKFEKEQVRAFNVQGANFIDSKLGNLAPVHLVTEKHFNPHDTRTISNDVEIAFYLVSVE